MGENRKQDIAPHWKRGAGEAHRKRSHEEVQVQSEIQEETMTDKIFKAGEQSELDPFEFVLSTDSRDRMGDIVDQDFSLAQFKKNPIALWAHSHASPIGTWEKLRKDTIQIGKRTVNRTIGRLKLAAEGTSEHIDFLRSMIEQRILKTVSIGFRPGKYEALDEDNPWNGYRLSENELLECSVVSVPANPEASSLAKSLDDAHRKLLFTETGEIRQFDKPAFEQLGIEKSRDSGATPKPPIKRTKTMSLSDKIEAKQQEINDLKDKMVALESEIADGEIPEETEEAIEELASQIDTAERNLQTLLRAEKALAISTKEDGNARAQAPSQIRGSTSKKPEYIPARKERKKGHFAIATIASLVKAHCNRQNPVLVAETEFKDEPEVALLARAATDPATTTDAAWAGPLVRETWGEFLELIRDMSVYPNLPGMRLEFDRYGKINLPKNVGRGQLAGAWVEEGKPIPVKEGAYGTVDLAPKKMALISTFTREIGTHSMPAIQGLIQNQMLEDTAETLDGFYLDDQARSTARPAGLQDATETGAANINASTGATAAAINADLKGMISRLLAARAGNMAVWIMSRINVLNLRMVQDAASGEFIFRAEVDNGTLLGYPILVSQNVPDTLVFLQGTQAVAYGNDYAPMIDVSDEATIVFDDTAPDHVLPDTNTQPAKSMFQTLSIAVRMHMALDWRITRQGGVQVLTTVAWT